MSMNRSSSITRVLIANRGEIARRIIRTCHELGIETVAVFTEVDAHAPYVSEASLSEGIGAATNYLSIDAIIAAAKRSGANAIHPGYGFLSENGDFAEAVIRAGLVFIGPKPETIRALGSKTNAKEIAQRASVPTSPTLLLLASTLEQQAAELAAFGNTVGFPLIIKAAAGGGGRGMRLVHASSSFQDELSSARREALKAFGREEIFVEKCIAPARHIEVQVAGDSYGNVVALGTRDCSLQRNNQKIIEEAPATGLKQGASEAILDAATRLAREVGYSNLGTVEFLYSEDGSFYFLEVNTRLQVEHPVTEMVTGLDLVELQLAIASGANLHDWGLSSAPTPNGHAIEARVCAEEFTGQFITTTGIILESFIPDLGAEVRADMGFDVCSEVTHHYDSMLGKVIAHAADRDDAINTLTEALTLTKISGVGNNRSLLLHLLNREEFRAQRHSVQGTRDLLPTTDQLHKELEIGHAILAAVRLFDPRSSWCESSPWMQADTYALASLEAPLTTTRYGRTISSKSKRLQDSVTVVLSSGGPSYTVAVIERAYPSPHHTQCSVRVNDGEVLNVEILADNTTVWLHTPSFTYSYEQSGRGGGASAGVTSDGEQLINSLIPGRIAALRVADGDSVTEGDVLIVLDSMKMEHPVKAPCTGTVTLRCGVGTIVQAGAILAVIKAT
jgi:acetyl/propionyl-CoA carboxylase alpha subunit